MDPIPASCVSIHLHVTPEIHDQLRAAARSVNLPIEQWLVRALARGVRDDLFGGRV